MLLPRVARLRSNASLNTVTAYRRRRALPLYLLMELLRFRLGVRAELAREEVSTDLVLPESKSVPTLPRLQTHQRTVRVLAQRILDQYACDGFGRSLERSALELHLQQPV
jgi:hypothetical protein